MKVDITDITKVNGSSVRLDFEEKAPESEPVEGYTIDGPVGFSGTLTNMNGMLELDGHLKIAYRTACYRCLKPIEGKLDIRIRESFINEKQSADEIDAYALEGKLLNTDKVFEDNIILNLPMKQVCTVDCKGLCPKCGINLNEASYINPQMEALNKFFNN